MTLLLVLAVAAATAAAIVDTRTGHIPNWITFGAFGAGVLGSVVAAASRGGAAAIPAAMLSCLAGAALCALVPFLLFRAKAIGGGDVKLFIALGAIGHPTIGLEMELCAFIAGALLAPIWLAQQGRLFATLGRSLRLLVHPLLPRRMRVTTTSDALTWFRLGPAFFVGTAYVAWTRWGT